MEPRTDGRNKFYSKGIIWNTKVRNKSVYRDAIYLQHKTLKTTHSVIMEYYADIKTDVYKELVITWEHADVIK